MVSYFVSYEGNVIETKNPINESIVHIQSSSSSQQLNFRNRQVKKRLSDYSQEKQSARAQKRLLVKKEEQYLGESWDFRRTSLDSFVKRKQLRAYSHHSIGTALKSHTINLRDHYQGGGFTSRLGDIDAIENSMAQEFDLQDGQKGKEEVTIDYPVFNRTQQSHIQHQLTLNNLQKSNISNTSNT